MRKILSLITGAMLTAFTITANFLPSSATNDEPKYVVFNFPTSKDHGSPFRYCIHGLKSVGSRSMATRTTITSEDTRFNGALNGFRYSWVFNNLTPVQAAEGPFVVCVPPEGQRDAIAISFNTEYWKNTSTGYIVTTLEHIVNLADCPQEEPDPANSTLSPFVVRGPFIEEFPTYS
jgi:hypothetical protein